MLYTNDPFFVFFFTFKNLFKKLKLTEKFKAE